MGHLTLNGRRSRGRIPSLDGLRAVSVLLVLFGHLLGTPGFFFSFPAFGPTSRMGVDVFFVISGFLITRLLLEERERTGAISLKDFYVRRIYRIFPAHYFYILAIHLLAADTAGLWRAMTYTVNYDTAPGWNYGHLWSLSVEEQFYLLWPFALSRLPRRNAILAAAGVVAISPLLRLATALWARNWIPLMDSAFHLVADPLAGGCLLALCWSRLEAWTPYQRFLQSRIFWLAPMVAFAAAAGSYYSFKFSVLAGPALQTAAIVATIERFTRYPESAGGAFLNWAPVKSLGVLSYSLYLWQQPFLHRGVESVWATFPLNLAAAFAAALVSYHLVEKPFLALRRRQPVTTPVPVSPR